MESAKTPPSPKNQSDTPLSPKAGEKKEPPLTTASDPPESAPNPSAVSKTAEGATSTSDVKEMKEPPIDNTNIIPSESAPSLPSASKTDKGASNASSPEMEKKKEPPQMESAKTPPSPKENACGNGISVICTTDGLQKNVENQEEVRNAAGADRPRHEQPVAADLPRHRVHIAQEPSDRALFEWNEENGSIKRFLDITDGCKIHIPTVHNVRLSLAYLSSQLVVKSRPGSFEYYDEHFNKHIKLDVMRHAILRRYAETLTQQPMNHRGRADAGRDISAAYEHLKSLIDPLCAIIECLTDDTSIIFVRHLNINGTLVDLEAKFREIIGLLDEDYKRSLKYQPDFGLFYSQSVNMNDDFPSLQEVVPQPDVNRVPPPIRPQINLNQGAAQVPVTIRKVKSYNHEHVHRNPITRETKIYTSGMAQQIFDFCLNNPGAFFECSTETGTGKTFVLSNFLTGLGVVGLAMQNEFHVKAAFRLFKKQGFKVEIRTDRYSKYGHLPQMHRERLFRKLRPSEDLEPALTLSGYEPMRSSKARGVELHIFTYETLRQLIKNRDFPDVLLLDDVRSSQKHKDLCLFLLRNSVHVPKNMIIGGLCAGPYDSGRFSFDSIRQNPCRQGHQYFKFQEDIGRPFRVNEAPESGRLLTHRGESVLVRLAQHKDTIVRPLLLARGRPDLLGILQNANNDTLFAEYLAQLRAMSYVEFADWVADIFYPNLYFGASGELADVFNIVEDSLEWKGAPLVPTDHTRLLSGDTIDDYMLFYERKLCQNSGNVLFFLPSKEAVMAMTRHLRKSTAARDDRWEIISVVGAHCTDELALARQPLQIGRNNRVRGRMVLVSPEAEASVTFPNVEVILDCATKYLEMVDNDTGMEYTLTLASNQQEKTQRLGRGGRTRASVYIELPHAPPDDLPGVFIGRQTDAVEMRTVILELLTVDAYTGVNVTREQLLERLSTWYTDIQMNILNSTLRLMEDDGICAHDNKGIFLTSLGFLMSRMPASYDNSYLVAMGAFFGCFRSMAAYVVGKNAFNELWNDGDARANAWITFFNRSTPVADDSHMDFVISVFYWFLKNENDQLGCLRANITPAYFLDLKYELYRFECAMFSFVCEYEAEQRQSWGYCANDDKIMVRRMALFAGSHGNLALVDKEHHALTFSGHVICRKNHVPGDAPMGRSCGFATFSRVRSANIDKMFGETCAGILIPLLTIDVSQSPLTKNNENNFFIRRHIAVHGERINEVAAIRHYIHKQLKGYLSGSFRFLDNLTAYLGRLSDYLLTHHAEIPDFESWDERLLAPLNMFPPAGLCRRRKWCSRCLHQGHVEPECVCGMAEVLFRHGACAATLATCAEVPRTVNVPQTLNQVAANGYQLEGVDHCQCFNLFHDVVFCRSIVCQDDYYCIRCGQSGHSHTKCRYPSYCNNCHVFIHKETRCQEDRLMIQQLYHMRPNAFILRFLLPNNPNKYVEDNLRRLHIPLVTDDYFTLPRIGNNRNPGDNNGYERELIEPIRHSFI